MMQRIRLWLLTGLLMSANALASGGGGTVVTENGVACGISIVGGLDGEIHLPLFDFKALAMMDVGAGITVYDRRDGQVRQGKIIESSPNRIVVKFMDYSRVTFVPPGWYHFP